MTDLNPPDVQAWLDQEDARVADRIRREGVFVQLVGGGECSVPGCCGDAEDARTFGYTIGLFGIAHPEFTVVGLSIPLTSTVLHAAARLVLDGERILPGTELTLPGWDRRVLAARVPDPGAIAYAANRYYQRPDEYSVPLLQLTYSDSRGRFPDDPRYTGSRRSQPRPGEWDAGS